MEQTRSEKNNAKDATVEPFELKKPSQSVDRECVFRVLLNLCRRPAIRFGLRRDPRGRFREPRFASFMAQGNRKPLDHDMHDAVLKGRKAMKGLFAAGLALGGAWVVIESAKALSVF
jgi:hypothetical protein